MNNQFNFQDTQNKRKEHKSLSVIGAIFGTIHTGFVVGAELTNAVESKLTEKITKGAISYEEAKRYRDISSAITVIDAKERFAAARRRARVKRDIIMPAKI